jgi:phenylpyruvate tautomerase PptA (4-oxalocrotonate tautomerase family)
MRVFRNKRIEEQKCKIKSRVTDLLKEIQGLNMQHDVV